MLEVSVQTDYTHTDLEILTIEDDDPPVKTKNHLEKKKVRTMRKSTAVGGKAPRTAFPSKTLRKIVRKKPVKMEIGESDGLEMHGDVSAAKCNLPRATGRSVKPRNPPFASSSPKPMVSIMTENLDYQIKVEEGEPSEDTTRSQTHEIGKTSSLSLPVQLPTPGLSDTVASGRSVKVGLKVKNKTSLLGAHALGLNENIASARSRRVRCGKCVRCKLADCGKCKMCENKPKFGGDGSMKKACLLKFCRNRVFKKQAINNVVRIRKPSQGSKKKVEVEVNQAIEIIKDLSEM